MITGINAVAASAGWTDAEFNVFGDGGNSAGGGQAAFGANSTIVVKTTVHNGTRSAPTCRTESFTGETNNLTLVGTSTIGTQDAPAIEFTQSNVPGSAAACATAGGFGDTHLSTFGGLLYDFQATGDFVLAQTDQDFLVAARQVSGAPSWPNASVNKAVATRMGKTRVLICSEPSRVVVDGKALSIEDGRTVSLPSGVDIQRIGNVYLVVSQLGDSMRAVVNDTYIDVSVGLGRWPEVVRGVLANAAGSPDQIATKDGKNLKPPFAFADLYSDFAESWRVPAEESLLAGCTEQAPQFAIPDKPFSAVDLEPQVQKRARAVCTAAGIKVKALLDACILDVAVIGHEGAAKVFVGRRPPVHVGRVLLPRPLPRPR